MLLHLTTEDRLSGSGQIRCSACNKLGCSSAKIPILIGDFSKAMHIESQFDNEDSDNTILSCGASRYLFESVWWEKQGDDERIFHKMKGDGDMGILVRDSSTIFSHWTNLTFDKFSSENNGLYRCQGKELVDLLPTFQFDFDKSKNFSLQFSAPIIQGHNLENLEVEKGTNATLYCTAKGNPEPTLFWAKDGNPIRHNDRQFVMSQEGNIDRLTVVNVRRNKGEGTYSCVAENRLGTAAIDITVKITRKSQLHIIISVSVSVVVIVFAVLGMLYFKRKAKRAKSRLSKKDVEKLKEGDPEGLSESDTLLLGEGDKALMLPYDKKLEFPFEKLILGSQIGAGAFGRVLKAQAREIVIGKAMTTVAVKTLKFPAEMDHLRALMSELKILSHIGKHPNLLNLLGACTARLEFRELYVILEYCHLGNMQQLLIRSRRVFRPSVMTQSKSLGKPITPKLSPMALDLDRQRSIYTNLPSPSLTDHRQDSFLSFQQSNEDFLTAGDLFIWALHIAKGMEYLSRKKVLHGDLACRNILVAEDGTAKISDFGLSKNMYSTNNIYKKQSDAPLPIKWLAPESIQDQVFTTQSDVWSYGITLWEMFSLGITPYPGMEPGLRLFEFLLQGNRMKSPTYAPGYVYDIMLGCWHIVPEQRLTFDRIVALLIREIRNSANLSAQLSPGFGSPLFENRSYFKDFPDVIPSTSGMYTNGPSEEEGKVDEDGYLISLKSPTAPSFIRS